MPVDWAEWSTTDQMIYALFPLPLSREPSVESGDARHIVSAVLGNEKYRAGAWTDIALRD